MGTLDDFQRRISKLEVEMSGVLKQLEELVDSMTPTPIGPPVVTVPTEELVEEAVEEAHVEVSEEKPEE